MARSLSDRWEPAKNIRQSKNSFFSSSQKHFSLKKDFRVDIGRGGCQDSTIEIFSEKKNTVTN
jgi:hypothetical protein